MRAQIKLALLALIALLLVQGRPLTDRAQGTITAGLEQWALPTPDSSLSGILYDPTEGAVYFAEFNADQIGRLDPATGELVEWSTGNGPNDLVFGNSGPLLILEPTTLYFTESLSGAVSKLVPSQNSYDTRPVISTGGFPKGIDFYADLGRPGEVWFSERLANQVGRVEVTQTFNQPIALSPQRRTLSPTTTTAPVSQSLLPPSVTGGNPQLAPAVALASRNDNLAVSEWDLSNFWQGSSTPEAVALTPDGKVWVGNSAQEGLLLLDPTSDILEAHDLPAGSTAVDLALDAAGDVWFTEGFAQRIGKLDPRTGDVWEWTLPQAGSQPLALSVFDERAVWFTEREGDRLGWFDATTGDLMEFLMPAGSHPLDLVAVAANEVWFTTERGNWVGHLTVTALGNPVQGQTRVTELQVEKPSQTEATVSVFYEYSGDQGLPVFITAIITQNGTMHPDFGNVPVRIEQVGPGRADIVVEYHAAACIATDGLDVVMFKDGVNFYVESFDAPLTWGC